MVLIFDYDGTLHNTAHLYGCAFRRAYERLVADGYAEKRYYSDEEMSRYLGMTADEMWQSFMPDLPPDIMKRTANEVGREMVNLISEGAAVLYDGIEEALSSLKDSGYTMVILSNCHDEYLQAHRNYFRLDRWFDGYYAAEKFGYIPKENIFQFIQRDFPDEKYIVIGDRESDFRVGTANGLKTVGCAYGFGNERELSICNKVIYSPKELLGIIKML